MARRAMAQPAARRRAGLYEPGRGHDACGVGVLVDLAGERSHRLVEQGFELLCNLDHRGARGAEEQTGDGAGMLLQIPHAFFQREIPSLGPPGSYGVAQIFLPVDSRHRKRLRRLVREIAEIEGLQQVGWRPVATDNAGLGATALASEPAVEQFFFSPDEEISPEALDVRLYVARRRMEFAAAELTRSGQDVFYICSMDRRTIVYKGLLTCEQLPSFYPELCDPAVTSRLVLVHSRFSTNTLGAWALSHPYRRAVHNGEFNTLRGNLNWMRAREADLHSPRFGADIDKVRPVHGAGGSDSAGFDNVLELLLLAGRTLPEALRLLIPEAWHKDRFMDPERRAMYQYYSTLMEPWDGPALVAATDGDRVAAILDRNGLRPARYCVTRDGLLILASETGVLDVPPEDIEIKGRLKPGQLLMADSETGRIVPEQEIFDELTSRPYGQWLSENLVDLDALIEASPGRAANYLKPPTDTASLRAVQRAAGYTEEWLRYLLTPMAQAGKDPVGAMGSDTPPAVLSADDKPLFNYFVQEFAQVSNPPLDYLREDLVTSLETAVGRQRNLLEETPGHCHQLRLRSPFLSTAQLQAIRRLDREGLRSFSLSATYPRSGRLKHALDDLRYEAERAVREGYQLLVLSDRDIAAARLALPSALAVAAIHHHLIRQGLRARAAIVADVGDACLVHHFCVLFGYGLDAVHPRLAYQSVQHLQAEGDLDGVEDPLGNYRRALEGGVLKVMAKMGISTLDSYKGAQIFATVGLDYDLVDDYFTGTTAHVPGVGLEHIEAQIVRSHAKAFEDQVIASAPLAMGGDLYWRREGELHQWNPMTLARFQQACRTGDREAYRAFATFINDQQGRLQTLRGLLDTTPRTNAAVPLAEVEPAASIMRRFASGSMSFGALSREAHEAIAAGINRIGGRSGTGEGGEQIERFGSERECSMKQVASGRFGVTAEYLARAREIEIKMAQGSKPGEGGELPGGKVDEGIAEVRFTVPGVGLISPPPHHDIYSIEDLAQLIHDLKCANPQAEVHVKLVAKAGVGTIAAGVAKARADAVLISGDSGGTGASVKTSIKHAGAPWELGLAETQQVLLANNLRSRIRLRVDGGLKTGRDVVVAAMLGAEEFGFGTPLMVAVGCIMLRKCHCNTCSVGVATQDPRLRAKFAGKPEHVVNYLRLVAEEVREHMAELGFRRFDEMIGRVDCLTERDIGHPKDVWVDLSELLYRQPSDDAPRRTRAQHHRLEEKRVDHRLIREARAALENATPVVIRARVTNRDRTLGTLLSSLMTKRHGGRGLPPDTIRVHLAGTAGQSFGAFLGRGISLHLAGDANDYVGKGLSGGRLSVRVPDEAGYGADNVIIGNVALYGATAGEAYFQGTAGERFAVRNSGAMAVVEGIGDHGCEYMTGGAVVVLGTVGRNFAAGMSGGEAYVIADDDLERRINFERVRTEPVSDPRDLSLLKRLLENHLGYTGSDKARAVLRRWPEARRRFVKVIPVDYANVISQLLAQGKDIRMAPPAPTDTEVA